MDLTKYSQFQLYLLTLKFNLLKSQLVPEGCDSRCIDSTIINRAYFSSYLYCLLWLEDVKHFRPIPIKGFDRDDDVISEHVQVRNALQNYDENMISRELSRLSSLRKKADYDPFADLTPDEVSDAVHHMERIFNSLKFE